MRIFGQIQTMWTTEAKITLMNIGDIGLRITITDTKGKRCMVDYSGSQLHWKDVPADTSNDGITLIEEALCFCFMLIFFDFVACAAVITLKPKKVIARQTI